MKKIAILVILTIVLGIQGKSQSCLPDGISFYTQESIDNFQINHPNCNEIEGHVWITDEDITNCKVLSCL